jgi:hypothetical protein
VTVLDRLDAYPFDYGDRFGGAQAAAEVVVGDTSDPQLVGHLVAGADVVVHAAAHADIAGCLSSPDSDFASNVLGTQTVLEAAREHRPERLVFISSASVYDDRSRADGVPRFAEDDRLGVASTYCRLLGCPAMPSSSYDGSTAIPANEQVRAGSTRPSQGEGRGFKIPSGPPSNAPPRRGVSAAQWPLVATMRTARMRSVACPLWPPCALGCTAVFAVGIRAACRPSDAIARLGGRRAMPRPQSPTDSAGITTAAVDPLCMPALPGRHRGGCPGRRGTSVGDLRLLHRRVRL